MSEKSKKISKKDIKLAKLRSSIESLEKEYRQGKISKTIYEKLKAEYEDDIKKLEHITFFEKINDKKTIFYALALLVVIGIAGAYYTSNSDQVMIGGPGAELCYEGEITYDEAKGLYFLNVKGQSFPFRANPSEAAKVKIEASGSPAIELERALLGKNVELVTVLIDAKDGDESLRAAGEIYGYLYTVRGGSVVWATTERTEMDVRVASLSDASPSNSIVYVKGPRAGATETRVTVDGNKILVEGENYKDLVKAADRVALEVAAVYCGSAACEDLIACTTGETPCGC